jgi:hypothetical protein
VHAAFVHDLTAGVLYASERLAGPLGSLAAVEDPLGVLARFSWVVERSVRGGVLGATCSPDGDQSLTRLFVAPESRNYR